VSATSAAPHLAVVLRPETGENGRGFLRRLAEANGHRSMRLFCRALGLGGGFGPASAGHAWRRLAHAASLTDAEVGAMRWNRTGRARLEARIVVSGTPTTIGFVDPKTDRLCPACFREGGIQRDFWSFSCIVACPRHGILLASACGCGRPLLSGTYGRTSACVCGAVPGELADVAAPAAAVRVARNVAARVGAASGYACVNDLGAPFDALCAHDLMVMVRTLGVAGAMPASADPPVAAVTYYRAGKAEATLAPRVALARLQAAMEVIDGWPGSYVALIRGVEGRNAAADASTVTGAFATSIGRSLLNPALGIAGLPLGVLRDAADRYWDDHHAARRRRRNLATADPTARRLRGVFGIKELAHALGGGQGDELHRSVLRRVLAGLTDDDRVLGVEELAALVRGRTVALHRAAMASLSSEAVKDIVEGKTHAGTLNGWEHPLLIPADPALHGLRYTNRRAYDPAVVDRALARLRTVARRVERPGGLERLVSGCMGRRLRPWYTKADVLLDVLAGRLPVYAAVDAPRLGDLLVDAGDVLRLSTARVPADRPVHEGFERYDRANAALERRFGPEARMTLGEFRRLARGGLVAHRVRSVPVGSRRAPHTTWLFSVEDLVGFAERRLGADGLAQDEAAAFGRTADIGPLLVGLKGAGMSAACMAGELAGGGIKTEDGAPWGLRALRAAIRRAEGGGTAAGLLTGPAFAGGGAPPGSAFAQGEPRRRI